MSPGRPRVGCVHRGRPVGDRTARRSAGCHRSNASGRRRGPRSRCSPRPAGSPRVPGSRPSWRTSVPPSGRGCGVSVAARTTARRAGRADLSKRLRIAAEALGPSYIKLGQIISSGEGLFPAELVDEFKRCRDQVPAEPFELVRLTVEQDLGRRLEDVFRVVRHHPARRRVDRPGPRSTPCAPARTWW